MSLDQKETREEVIYSIKAAAKKTGLNEVTIRRAIKTKALKASRRVGSTHWKITEKDLQTFDNGVSNV